MTTVAQVTSSSKPHDDTSYAVHLSGKDWVKVAAFLIAQLIVLTTAVWKMASSLEHRLTSLEATQHYMAKDLSEIKGRLRPRG